MCEGRVTMVPCPLASVPTVSQEITTESSRRDVLLAMLQKEYPSYHPLVSIARIAHDQAADLKLQFECHKTIAKYVEPELKSLEVKGELGHRHRVSVSLFEEPGAEFTPVVAQDRPALEGSSTRVLPGGATIDLDPRVTDRVVGGW